MSQKDKIKILHIQLLPLLSGVQNVMLDIIKNLPREQFEFSVISAPIGPLIPKLKEMKVRHYSLPGLVREIKLFDIIILLKMYRICRLGKFDIVHTHSSKTGFLGRIAAKLAGIPIVMHTIHGFPFNPFQTKITQTFYKSLERIASMFCDMTISVNNSERKLAIEENIIPHTKIMTIYNGIIIADTKLESIARQELGFSNDDVIVGTVCRFSSQKNIITMVKTAIEVAAENPYIKFIFLGDGELWDEAQQLVIDSDRDSDILLPGWQTNVREWLSLFDIYFLFSLWEGLSLSIIEAMAMGLPIISSNIKGNNELVRDGYNGYLVKIGKKTLLKEKLQWLSTHKDTRRKMGEKSSMLVREICSIRTFSESYMSLYHKLISKKVI